MPRYRIVNGKRTVVPDPLPVPPIAPPAVTPPAPVAAPPAPSPGPRAATPPRQNLPPGFWARLRDWLTEQP